jgi:hypothetical protein
MAKEFPHIKFVVYDTSDAKIGEKKILVSPGNSPMKQKPPAKKPKQMLIGKELEDKLWRESNATSNNNSTSNNNDDCEKKK